MSHQHTAAVWTALNGRRDIDQIVQEIVGQYYLDTGRYNKDLEKANTSALRLVVALRTIFDLQRVYLQSSDLSSKSESCLIQPELTLSVLFLLLEIKASSFGAAKRVPNHDAQRSYIGQTLLSGLRTLMLHPTKLPGKEYNDFTRRFEEVWGSESLSDVDHFTINLLCHRMLAELADASQRYVYSRPACGLVRLPDFYRGLYPLEQAIVTAVHRSLAASQNSTDWFHGSLALYDIFWSVKAAVIQLCMHVEAKKWSGSLSFAEESARLNDIHLILIPYSAILDTLYQDSSRLPSPDTSRLAQEQMRTLLCLDLDPACIRSKCQCLDGTRTSVQELWLRRGGQEVLANLNRSIERCRYLEPDASLDYFQAILNARSLLFPGIVEELEVIAQKVAECTVELGTGSSASGPKSPSFLKLSQHIRGRIELLQTPRASPRGTPSNSPVPTALSPRYNMAQQLVRGRAQVPRKSPSQVHNLHSIDESARDGSYPEQLPRMHASSALSIHDEGLMVRNHGSLRKVPSDNTVYSNSTDSTVYLGASSRASSGTYSPRPLPSQEQCTTLPEVVNPETHSKNISPTGISSRSGESRLSNQATRPWSIFKGSNRGVAHVSSIPSAAFFTSGRALLLWNELGAIYYDLESIPVAKARQIISGDVQIAAGGTRKCATVTKSGSVILLQTFLFPNETPVHEIEVEEVPFRVAISSNDHYIALKFGNYVRILDTLSGNTFHHKLPYLSSRSGPNDHLITFSTDCLSFIASTRFEPEKVISYFCDCRNPSLGKIVESSAPYGLVSDCGLSSIVYSNKSAFLTTFTEKGYPVFLSLSENRSSIRPLRDKNQQVGSRIHSAALCSTGQNLVMLNDRNELYWINNPFGKEQSPSRVGSIKRTKSVKKEVEIAIPDTDEVHVFWVEKRKGVLVTMGRFGGKSKPVDLNIDMDQLVES